MHGDSKEPSLPPRLPQFVQAQTAPLAKLQPILLRRNPGLAFVSLLIGILISRCAGGAVPYSYTQPPGPISSNSASLKGMTVPNGLPTMAWFEWGTRGTYTASTDAVLIGSGASAKHVSIQIGGLTNRGVYQCRLVSSNAAGIACGAPQIFTTGKKVTGWGKVSWGTSVGVTNVVALAAGDPHTLALLATGDVWAWPYAASGAYVPYDLRGVVAISAFHGSSLALKADGTVVSWGDLYEARPRAVSNVIAIATGFSGGLGLKSMGDVVAWGYNTPITNVPPGLSNVVAIATGGEHGIALKADGTIAAWGGAWYREVTNTPPNLSNVVAVAAGGFHTLALRKDGTLVSWGNDRFRFGVTNVPVGLNNVVAIACGEYHSLALREDGKLVAWGSNTGGQTNVPLGLSNVVTMAGGYEHSFAVADNFPPVATSFTNSGLPNKQQLVQLRGSDPNRDFLSYRVTSLPAKGRLRQYGSLPNIYINQPGVVVSNLNGYLFYEPPANEVGANLTSFQFVTNDGEENSSMPGVVTISALPPAPPQISVQESMTLSDGRFRLNFSGTPYASHRIWASTNLADWHVLGGGTPTSEGQYFFVDSEAPNWPLRYYRIESF